MQRAKSVWSIVKLFGSFFIIFLVMRQRVNTDLQQQEINEQIRQDQKEAVRLQSQREWQAPMVELKAQEAEEVANYCRYYQTLSPAKQQVARKEGKAKLRYMINKENQRQLEACLGLSQQDVLKRK